MHEVDGDYYRKMYRDMLLIRHFELALEREFKKGQVPGMLHIGVGQEAALAAVANVLRTEDGLFPDHRCHGLLFLKGTPGERIMAELFGRATGICSGKGGSLHSADASVNNFGDNGVEGSYMVTALGIALGWKMQGENRLVAVMLGDGTSGRGEWHESLNLAAVWKLPILYCCVNNGYAISTSVGSSHATENLVDFARPYGIPAVQVDGNDLLAAYSACRDAADHILAGNGPAFIEFKTWRWQGLFKGEFRSEEEVHYWKVEHEPLSMAERDLVAQGIATQAELQDMQEEVCAVIEDWVQFAKDSPMPEARKAVENVYVGWEAGTK
jgi:TPP-dependent pyruvate/acetoin dehydrogenase alpha subunit